MKQSAYLIQQRETRRRLVQALIPFGERYPEIREITYGPRRAGKG